MLTFCGANVIVARVSALLFTLMCVNAFAIDNDELTNLAKVAIEHSQQYQKQLQTHANSMNAIQKSLLNTQHMQPKLFIAISFSMPEKLILDYMQQASQYNAWVVVQGFQGNEMPVMLYTLAQWDKHVDISRLLIDPNVFKQYQITEVPSLILTTDPYPCDSQKCIATSFDKIVGSVRLDHALKTMAERGDLYIEAKAWKGKTMKESTRATFFGILALILFIYSHTLPAQTKFYQDHAQGWHWYEKMIQPEHHSDEKNITQVTSEQALSELNILQKELEGAKALAVMYPTAQHIEQYIRLHNTVIEKASLFSSQWQQVIWQTPELNLSIDKPTDNSARHLYYDLEKTVDRRSIQSLVDEYGLFFFFRESCPYCHAFAPVLRNIENQYGINVMAISLDDGTLPEYPNAASDNGLAQQLGVEVVPALYALHPESQQVIPLSFGFVSEAELMRRISTLATAQGSTP